MVSDQNLYVFVPRASFRDAFPSTIMINRHRSIVFSRKTSKFGGIN